jgi:5-methylcytosine-specific restriction endonuclease McrA
MTTVGWVEFYKTARWQRLRRLQLKAELLCKFCLERGHVTAANVADHVEVQRGDWTVFCTGELQSLCEPCHKSAKRQIELWVSQRRRS